MARYDMKEVWRKSQETVTEDFMDGWNVKCKRRTFFVISKLLDLTKGEKLPQEYIAEYFGVNRQTVRRDMKPFIDAGLVESRRGYVPTENFFKWIEVIYGSI